MGVGLTFIMLPEYILLAAVLPFAAVAQTNIAELISQIPTCAEECALGEIVAAGCQVLNLPECICTNTTLQLQLSTCVLSACNAAEQILSLTVLQQQVCDGIPQPSRSGEILRISIILTIITVLAVALRCLSRFLIVHQFWWDDWAIITAAALMVPLSVFAILYPHYGFGKHIWDVDPLKINLLRKVYYVVQIIYVFVQTLAKLSVLFLYLRLFPGSRFRVITKICIVWMVCHLAGFLIAVTLQCLPIKALWDTDIKGRCVNSKALGFAGAGASIFEDFVVILLPVSELKSLHLDFRKKIAVIFMFAAGSFACIASIIRLRFITAFSNGNSPDATWDQVDVIIWSEIEAYTAVICACLITFRGLLVKYFPGLFTVTRAREPRYDSTLPVWRARRGSKIAGKIGYANIVAKIYSESETQLEGESNGEKSSGARSTIHALELEEMGRLC